MGMSRRDFAKAGIGTGILMATGDGALAEEGLIRRAIPSSGETIPVIGVGTNRYGVGSDEEARAPLREALRKFHELGGTLIDTAPAYRSSEIVLGELIGELGIVDDLFLATKVDGDDRAESESGMERSFARLGTDVMDLMQVHNFIGWQDSIPLMREWKDEGRIRYIGITSSRTDEYELMEQVMRDHELDFIQINYSLADQRTSADRILPLAADRGMAVLINRPFGGGNAFGKLSGLSVPDWARDFDCESWGQFLLKYVLSHDAVTATIPGMTKERHVIDNLGAARGALPTAAQRRRQEEFFDAL